jgi:hypothetical protein
VSRPQAERVPTGETDLCTSEKHQSAAAAGRWGILPASLTSAGIVVLVLALGQVAAGAGPSPAKIIPAGV